MGKEILLAKLRFQTKYIETAAQLCFAEASENRVFDQFYRSLMNTTKGVTLEAKCDIEALQRLT